MRNDNLRLDKFCRVSLIFLRGITMKNRYILSVLLSISLISNIYSSTHKNRLIINKSVSLEYFDKHLKDRLSNKYLEHEFKDWEFIKNRHMIDVFFEEVSKSEGLRNTFYYYRDKINKELENAIKSHSESLRDCAMCIIQCDVSIIINKFRETIIKRALSEEIKSIPQMKINKATAPKEIKKNTAVKVTVKPDIEYKNLPENVEIELPDIVITKKEIDDRKNEIKQVKTEEVDTDIEFTDIDELKPEENSELNRILDEIEMPKKKCTIKTFDEQFENMIDFNAQKSIVFNMYNNTQSLHNVASILLGIGKNESIYSKQLKELDRNFSRYIKSKSLPGKLVNGKFKKGFFKQSFNKKDFKYIYYALRIKSLVDSEMCKNARFVRNYSKHSRYFDRAMESSRLSRVFE